MKRLTANDLTNEEKIHLIIGKNLWSNDSLNNKLPTFICSDGPVGLRHPLDPNDWGQSNVVKSIAYPSFEILSSTWNLDLAKEYGECIANDCIEQNVDMILGPGLNIKRLSLNGRNFEYLSEDPLIAGLFAKSYIEGVQENHVGACMKHFCLNNTEISRNYKSMDADDRTIREIYLKGFEIASKAKPRATMCSYNMVNGIKMTENKKLYSVLRNEFGFDGFIMSDWWAVFDRNASLNAGLDLEMPFEEKHLNEMLQKLNNNEINLNQLNISTQRILDYLYKNEDEKLLRKITKSPEKRRNLALQVAEEGIVLLKNKDHCLPLNKNEKIEGFGHAFKWYVFGGGSSTVSAKESPILLGEALKEEGFDINYRNSFTVHGHEACVEDVRGSIKEMIDENRGIAIISVGQDCETISEGRNRQTMSLTKEEESLILEISKIAGKTLVILSGGGCIDMKNWIDSVDAIIYSGYPGENGFKAVAEIISGKINPSGKLTETFPLNLEDVEANKSYESSFSSLYSEGLNVGYRQFVTTKQPILFPFGYGLSYSNFIYKNLAIQEEKNILKIEVEIENNSDLDGKEIIQIYSKELVSTTYRPEYELRGFKKVFIKAHESVKEIIEIDKNDLGFYSLALDKWTLNKGMYEILIGSSSIDIKLRKRIKIQ